MLVIRSQLTLLLPLQAVLILQLTEFLKDLLVFLSQILHLLNQPLSALTCAFLSWMLLLVLIRARGRVLLLSVG